MKRSVYLIVVTVLVASVMACNKGPATTSADSVSKPVSSADSAPVGVPANAPANIPDKIMQEPKITIPAGTKLHVALLDAVSSDKSRPGDAFTASLAEPVVVDGKTVFAKGAGVRGRVIDAKESGRVKGRASIELTLTEIIPSNGKAVNISTKAYQQVAEATKKRDAEIIGGGAGIGAVIGAIAGGGKGAAIGAGVGGGAGAGTVLATKGKEIHLAPETRLPFTLAAPIEM